MPDHRVGNRFSMRPFIICHMATSIDGRLHPSRFTSPAAGISAGTLAGYYEEVAGRFAADGWIVGRKTMSELAKGAERAVTSTAVSTRELYVGDRKDRNL